MTEEKAGERVIRSGERKLRADLEYQFGELADLVAEPGADEPGGEAKVRQTFVSWAIPEDSPLILLPQLDLKAEHRAVVGPAVLFECRDSLGNIWNLTLTPQFARGSVLVPVGIREDRDEYERYPDEVYREWEARGVPAEDTPEPSVPFGDAVGLALAGEGPVPMAEGRPLWSSALVERWLLATLAHGAYKVEDIVAAAGDLGIPVFVLNEVKERMGVKVFRKIGAHEWYWRLP